MKSFWWKLPVLRGLSPFSKGVLEAITATFACTVVSFFGLYQLFPEPDQTSAALAQVGATLLVAYAVQASWVLRASRKRGPDRENWVGIAAGIGFCALIGILLALALAAHHEPLNWLEAFAFGWVVVANALLGGMIAFQPWAMYHWTHRFNTEIFRRVDITALGSNGSLLEKPLTPWGRVCQHASYASQPSPEFGAATGWSADPTRARGRCRLPAA